MENNWEVIASRVETQGFNDGLQANVEADWDQVVSGWNVGLEEGRQSGEARGVSEAMEVLKNI